jgi:peptide deformylase
MSVREIINIPDPILRQVSKPVEQITPELLAMLDDMAETMYEAPGIGLAGIQIALPLRVVVVDCDQRSKAEEEADDEAPKRDEAPQQEERNPIFLINPEITFFSEEPSTYEEGCLSIPEYYAEVERPAGCVVNYIDRDGKGQVLKAEGLLSTCLQHEIDHLNGELFIDHISKLKRDRVLKKFSKIAKLSGIGHASPLTL